MEMFGNGGYWESEITSFRSLGSYKVYAFILCFLNFTQHTTMAIKIILEHRSRVVEYIPVIWMFLNQI